MDQYELIRWVAQTCAVGMSAMNELLRVANPSQVSASLKQRATKYILQNLQMSRLPERVDDEVNFRVWQRRFQHFRLWRERQRVERLDYRQGNPVKRKSAGSPIGWLGLT